MFVLVNAGFLRNEIAMILLIRLEITLQSMHYARHFLFCSILEIKQYGVESHF